MKNYILHEELKQLSGFVYRNKKFKKPKGWIEYNKFANPKNGFYGETFLKDEYAVIDFKGTDSRKPNGRIPSGKDLSNDIFMIASLQPYQIVDARIYYEQIKKKFPNKKIILSGHSLGGSMAQILAAETGEDAITFNAYGTANLTKTTNKNLSNIINYGNTLFLC